MQLTPVHNLIYTRETDTLRAPSGARIERFENTARPAATSPTQFAPLGASFEGAVRAANMRAQASHIAQAVVQGYDGAYFATPLVDTHGQPLPFDGVTHEPHPTDKRGRREPVERVVHTDWVLRLDPALQAVVGEHSWANFTKQRVEFGLELIQSATAK